MAQHGLSASDHPGLRRRSSSFHDCDARDRDPCAFDGLDDLVSYLVVTDTSEHRDGHAQVHQSSSDVCCGTNILMTLGFNKDWDRCSGIQVVRITVDVSVEDEVPEDDHRLFDG